MRRRRQPRRWALAASVLVAALLVLAPAGPAGAVGRISAAGGYGPSWVPGRHLPVSVTVEADRLLRGELEVTLSLAGFDGSTSRARLAVEVPGGSRKTFVVVVPPVFLPEGMQAPGATLAARVVDGDGDALAESDEQGLQGGGDVDLVGILPGALTSTELPRTAPLAVDAGLARLVELTGPQLRQAPASLDPLSTVAGGPDDLAALAPSVRQGVLRWLGDGGQLLVDAAPGTVVAGLPEAWQPGPEGFGPAGLGRVRLTGGAMAAGQWDRLVEPGTTGVGGDPTFAFFGG
ncbi:MAG TPA: hypothetical protein VFO65_12105, partial [Acidimicrobiales bacterium]|nr:hypothetical protein [Acidimicrobiales bacterium]